MTEKTDRVPDLRSIHNTSKAGIMPEYALRHLVKLGVIPGIYTGNKFLVNVDLLQEMLNDPEWMNRANEKIKKTMK